MYSVKGILTKNPIQITGAVTALLNFLIIAHVVHLTSEVVAGANSTLTILLGLFVVTNTVNKAKLDEFFEPPNGDQTQEYS